MEPLDKQLRTLFYTHGNYCQIQK